MSQQTQDGKRLEYITRLYSMDHHSRSNLLCMELVEELAELKRVALEAQHFEVAAAINEAERFRQEKSLEVAAAIKDQELQLQKAKAGTPRTVSTPRQILVRTVVVGGDLDGQIIHVATSSGLAETEAPHHEKLKKEYRIEYLTVDGATCYLAIHKPLTFLDAILRLMRNYRPNAVT